MDTAIHQNHSNSHHHEQSASSSSSTSIQKEERKELPRKLKYFTAAAIFYGNITFGCAFNTYGPVITSLQNKYETDDATISKVFTILTGSYMVGGLCGAFIFNFVNRQLAVITTVLTMAAMMFLTPHCPTITTFFLTAAVLGVCCGIYDAAQLVWMMEMMQKDCPPFVQSQHFFYAVGTNLVTWIMAPFLVENNDVNPATTTTPLSLQDQNNHFAFLNESTMYRDVIIKADNVDSKLLIPYTIVGTLVSLTGIAQALLFIFMRYHPPPPETTEVTERQESGNEEETSEEQTNETETLTFKIGSWPLAKLRIVVLCAAFFGAYAGMEMCTFQFFPKFAQNSELNLTESESAYVLSGMTAAFAVGRGIAIIAVFKISAQLIICANIVLVIVANVFLISWAQRSLTMLWTSSLLFGIGLSSTYPSFCAYIERYLNFTNFIGSIMIVGGSGVASIYPLIIGSFIEKNPIVLSYVAFFSIFFMILSFGTLSYLTHKDKKRR